MAARLSAFVIWALVAAGAVFWGYRFWAPATPLPANVQVVSDGAAPRADLTRLLGAAPAAAVEIAAPVPVAEISRFRLLGVVAPKPAVAAPGLGSKPATGTGVALIAIDGKPPRAFAVGTRVDGDLLLTAVSHRSASLGAVQGAPGMVLELPPLVPPATGSLPRAVAGADAARAAPPPGMAPNAAAMQAAGAALGSPQRSPLHQAQQAQQAQQAAAQAPGAESDDEDEAPAPPAPPPRPGAPLTR